MEEHAAVFRVLMIFCVLLLGVIKKASFLVCLAVTGARPATTADLHPPGAAA